MNGKFLIALGASLAGVSVITGAFGAHAVREKLEARMFEIYQTANHYLQIHAIALLAFGLWVLFQESFYQATNKEVPAISFLPAWLFILGIVVFCGSLFAMTATGIRVLGAITPIGGFSFIIAWFLFAVQVWKSAR